MLYSHSFALFGLDEPMVFGKTVGTLAVAVFFIVSGYLISQSWDSDPHPIRFAQRRALRIFPGLLVAVLFTTFFAGAIDTTIPLREYFLADQTWAYFFSNVSLVVGDSALPGAFEKLPVPGPNGSLWTLRYEVLMYVVVAIIGTTQLLRLGIAAVFAISLVSWGSLEILQIHALHAPIPVLWRIGLSFDGYRIAYLGTYFFAGSLLYFFRTKIPLSSIGAASLVAVAFFVPDDFRAISQAAIIPYATIVLAYKLPQRLGNLRGWDPSYGIYIYAFPVQQLLTRLFLNHGLTWLMCFAASVVMTTLLAMLSWAYIEKPALALKSRLYGKRSRLPLRA